MESRSLYLHNTGVLRFSTLNVGEILEVFATDIVTRREGSFKVQVAGMIRGTQLIDGPVFQFLESSFNFLRSDRKTPTRVPAGVLARPGASATFIERFDQRGATFNGIQMKQDYFFRDFEPLTVTDPRIFVRYVSRVEVFDRPVGWNPPEKRIEAYIGRFTKQGSS